MTNQYQETTTNRENEATTTREHETSTNSYIETTATSPITSSSLIPQSNVQVHNRTINSIEYELEMSNLSRQARRRRIQSLLVNPRPRLV